VRWWSKAKEEERMGRWTRLKEAILSLFTYVIGFKRVYMSLIGSSHFGTHRCPSPCYTATGHNPSYFLYSRPYSDCPTPCAFTTGVRLFFASPGLHTRSSRASGQIWESGPLLAAGAAVWGVWWDPPSDKVDSLSFRGLFPLASDSHFVRFVLSRFLSIFLHCTHSYI
jgi:hypothetical protein